MTETTITLRLPIRRVVLGTTTAPPPNWLKAQHQRLGLIALNKEFGGEKAPAAKTAASDALEAQLREELVSLETASRQLQSAAHTVHVHWQQIVLPEIQQMVVELAHAIAAKLVLDQVASDQFPIENLVREVVGRLNTDQPTTVKLHPADFAVWERHVSSHLTEAALNSNVTVQADAALERGDCQATAGEVSIVYELRRQIDELRQQLVS